MRKDKLCLSKTLICLIAFNVKRVGRLCSMVELFWAIKAVSLESEYSIQRFFRFLRKKALLVFTEGFEQF
jgi:hypothetical protein